MKIALVAPEWGTENSYPPLGLAYIAAVLEKDHNVRIFDLTLNNKESIENKMADVINFSPDIIAISSMSHNYPNAIKDALYLKAMTGAFIVFGGPHPTIMPKDVLKNEFVDFVITGEGEETFQKLCQNIGNKEFSGIEGLCYKENGNIIIQPKSNYIENLDSLPFPARHLLRINDYRLVDDYGHKMATIVSSRGCPYRCTYCYKGLFGRTYRQRSSQNIIEEIEYCIENFGYRSFYFIDDLFTMDTKRVEEITRSIKDSCTDIRWQCLARVNNVTPKMFQQMKDAGCYKVHFGIESGNQNILNKVKKGITLDQVRNAVKYCKDAGIRTKGYFMIGMPGDTIETMQDTLNFAKELGLNDVMFSITTPFPGTELWENIDKDKTAPLSDAFYCSDNSENIRIFYNLSNVTDKELVEMMRRAQQVANDIRTKTICVQLLGGQMGILAWYLSKINIFRETGRRILHRKVVHT